MASIDIKNLRKSFGSVDTLKDISLLVNDGDFLVLVGPSGCGKSTLLSLVAGFEGISGGEILIDGKSVAGIHPSMRDVAMVFQSYALYPSMSVAENMAFGLEMRGVPKPQRDARVLEVAKMLQIDHLLKRKPGQLSGGQRQRVAMGRALVRSPRLFLFDEPLSNLDAKLRVEMRTEIKKLHQILGTTMIYVTHDQVEAMTLATKIAVLKDGELQQFGTPDEVYGRPANTFVAGFMGSPSMNLVQGKLTRGSGSLTVDVAAVSGKNMSIAVTVEQGAQLPGDISEVLVGIRPEAIFEIGQGQTSRKVAFDSRLEVVEPAGSDTYIVTSLGGTEITGRVRGDFKPKMGSDISLEIDLSKLSFFDPQSGLRLGLVA